MPNNIFRRTDSEAMDAIADLLDGNIWSPDTLDEIAAIVRSTDRKVEDPDDDSDTETEEE